MDLSDEARGDGQLTRFLAAQQSGAFVPPTKLTLAAFVDPWFEGLWSQGRKASTRHGPPPRAVELRPDELRQTALQDIRVTDLDSLYGELLRAGRRGGGGLSMSTTHHVHAVLNKLLNDAERKGLVTQNGLD